MTFISLLSHREPLLCCSCWNWAENPPILMEFNVLYHFFILINTVNEHVHLSGGCLLGKVVEHNNASKKPERCLIWGILITKYSYFQSGASSMRDEATEINLKNICSECIQKKKDSFPAY